MSSHRYIVTTHAVSRFIERVRPGLNRNQAELELERILAHGELTDAPPVWLADRAGQDATMYVSLGDIALPLAPSRERVGHWVTLTCLTTGSLSPVARARRNQAHARRRRSRQRTDVSRSPAASRPWHSQLADEQNGGFE
jgi:hypothetical protein